MKTTKKEKEDKNIKNAKKNASRQGKIFERLVSNLFKLQGISHYRKPNIRFKNDDIFGADVLLLNKGRIVPIQIKYRSGIKVMSEDSLFSFFKNIFNAARGQYGRIDLYTIVLFFELKPSKNLILYYYAESNSEEDSLENDSNFELFLNCVKEGSTVFKNNRFPSPDTVYYINNDSYNKAVTTQVIHLCLNS